MTLCSVSFAENILIVLNIQDAIIAEDITDSPHRLCIGGRWALLVNK